jgi:glycerate dehydrogenase
VHIVFLDRNTFSDSIVFPVAHLDDCEWREFARTAPDQILDRAAHAEAIVTNKVKLSGALLERLPKLKLIVAAATGVDHIDVAAARHLGIGVCNVHDYAIHSVPEHVFALLLALKRNLPGLQTAAHDGRWSASDSFTLHTHAIDDLAGGTLGIVGAGTLGHAVVRLGTAFGMRVLLAERRGAAVVRPGRAAFAQVLCESDVLSIHVPFTPETRQLIGAAEFARMKPGAMLINAARGGVVDETALLNALRAGHLAGAGIDVLAHEPPPADHPLLTANLPNLIVTPHVAWASHQAQQRLAEEIVANIAAFSRGEARNRVV